MHPARTARAARRRLARSLGALVCAVALAAPAAAIPVDVFFDGNPTAADPNTNFGISETRAFDLRDSLGFEILDETDFAFVGGTAGAVGIASQTITASTVNPPGGPSRATSSWQIENVSGNTLNGAAYLLFTQSDVFTVAGVTLDYIDSNVGMTLDPALGWSIFRTQTSEGNFYFPALRIDRGPVDPLQGSIPTGIFPDPFDVKYILRNEPLRDAPVGSMEYQLPELGLGFAFQPIPEPGTGTLLVLGLAGLARRARRRRVG